MDQRTLRILEWDKIVARVSDSCQTNMGKEYAAELRPLVDVDLAALKLRETAEAKRFARSIGGVPFGGIRDVRRPVQRCRLGSVAESKELADILSTLQGEAKLRRCLLEYDGLEYLAVYAREMGAFRPVEEELARCLTDEGEVDDHASSDLAKIRSQLRTFQNRIREKVDSILRSSENQKYFQEAIVTIRHDRFVLPVKHEYRNNVPGIVHDQSASGATLFVEPMAVVEMGNQLRQLEAQEHDEVYRILAVLSARVGDEADMLLATLETMAYLDLTFAKAAYADAIRATEPDLNNSGLIDLRKARHPLLRGEVVPVDITLGGLFSTLVITGPNTGGKTVTLKTTGLLTVMAQAGLHIPCEIGSRIAVFDGVFSDIGDEQSIEQSLSTFSSHMVHIVRILEEASPNSLVLLDELGAGTDPTEGAALAMSILELLHARGVRTVATTHYSELKTFAYTREGTQNASVEFDIETLRPTYRLLIGVPGSSNAFAIASRLGLQDSVVERARAFLTQDDIKVETLIRGIESDRKHAEESRREAQQLRLSQDKLKKQYEDELERAKKDRADIMRKAHEEAKTLVEATRRECDSMATMLKDAARDGEFRDAARMVRDELRTSGSRIDGELKALQPKRPARAHRPVGTVIPGQEVHVISLDQKGRVLTVPNASGEVSVQMGIMKMNVQVTDLERVDEVRTASVVGKPQKTSNVAAVGRGKVQSATLELDLRGLLVEEALERTDKYLDDITLAGVGTARIIHGKGTGALRHAVREMLATHPSIRSYRFGEAGEGGDGVTVVSIRE